MEDGWSLLEEAFGLNVSGVCETWRENTTVVRMGVGRPIRVRKGGEERFLTEQGTVDTHAGEWLLVSKRRLQEGINRLARYSLYAYEEEIGQGFLTVRGGHRVGVCGRAVVENGRIRTLTDLSAVIFRMAHEVKGCADSVIPCLLQEGRLCHTLILSPPGCGKTTLLRDLLRQCSDRLGMQVGIVDERSEIAACQAGVPQLDVGMRSEVLDGAPKEAGIRMLLRSAAPQVIGADEIGRREEAVALSELMHCGVKVLCSVHAGSREEAMSRRELVPLIQNGLLERIILLKGLGEIAGIWNEKGERVDVELENPQRRGPGTDGIYGGQPRRWRL